MNKLNFKPNQHPTVSKEILLKSKAKIKIDIYQIPDGEKLLLLMELHFGQVRD